MKKGALLFFFITAGIIFKIFFPWFFTKEIIGGDWPYYYPQMVKEFSLVAPAWISQGVIGGINQNFPLFSYLYFIGGFFTNILGIPWVVSYKLFFFGLFIFLSGFSIAYLVKTIFNKASLLQVLLSIFLYTTNTYILMVAGGGQMGIVLAYSVAPLVLALFIKTAKNSYLPEIKNEKLKMKNSLILGLLLTLQLLFDLRILFIILISMLLYFLLNIKRYKNLNHTINGIFKLFVFPVVIMLLLHAYWIFPFFYFKLFSIPAGLTSVAGFNFFSFADFSHAFSLLHPNWPENVFGKTYFMKPEFILLPILAFSSLLFLTSKARNKAELYAEQRGKILFFVLLALIGSFLAKGVKPPFGEINQWMFVHIPGMNMFRDSTKFYTMIALSYSVLIPFSINEIYKSLSSTLRLLQKNSGQVRSGQEFKVKNYFPSLFLIVIVSYLIFLVRPAVFGNLRGTFSSAQVPKEYEDLNSFVVSQKDYFGTLWVPTQSRFRFQTSNHPLVNANELFGTENAGMIVKELKNEKNKVLLEELGVKYVVIPYDATSEIFLTDRKYDDKKRLVLKKEMDKIFWLKKINDGKITVYETPKNKSKFWLTGDGNISFQRISDTQYNIDYKSLVSNTIVFPNIYNKYWRASFDSQTLNSVKTPEGFNSFKIPKGEYKIKIYFLPQRYIEYGYIFSGMIFVIIVSLLVFSKKK